MRWFGPGGETYVSVSSWGGKIVVWALKNKKNGFWVGRREGYPLWLAGNEVFGEERQIFTIFGNNLVGWRLLPNETRLLLLGTRSLLFGGRLLSWTRKRKMTYVREGKGLTQSARNDNLLI